MTAHTTIKAKRRRKAQKAVTLAQPTSWDMGATGQANRIGLLQEPATELDPTTGKDTPNPNGVKRMRRLDMLEVYHRKGEITTEMWNAAEKLRDAFEATQRSAGWPDNDRVQSSPKPDHAVTIQIDRLSRFHSINRMVRPEDKPIIDACVLSGNGPTSAIINGAKPYRGSGAAYQRGMDHLRDALKHLAGAMG